MAEKEGGGALKGLRQLTMDRGPQGYGFHMYTNKVLKVSLMTTSGPVAFSVLRIRALRECATSGRVSGPYFGTGTVLEGCNCSIYGMYVDTLQAALMMLFTELSSAGIHSLPQSASHPYIHVLSYSFLPFLHVHLRVSTSRQSLQVGQLTWQAC